MDTTAPRQSAVRLATAYRQSTLERPATTHADDETTVIETEAPADAPATWSGVIVVEGTPTGDGRLIEHGALVWEASDESPILLRYVRSDVGAHDGAEVVGRIYRLERLDNGNIMAYGDFDMGSEIGREAHRQVKENLTRGVSVDLDDVAFEIRVAQDVLEDDMLVEPVVEDEGEDAPDEEPIEEMEVDEQGRVTVAKVEKDSEMFVTTEARVRAATLVATPAFAEAFITVDDEAVERDTSDADADEGAGEGEGEDEDFAQGNGDPLDSLIAAAAPEHPPATWFRDPEFAGPTAINVTDGGRIFGHVATWDTCHIAQPMGPGTCVMAPRSKTDYAHFHTGALRTKEGKELAVGHITLDTGHAGPKLNANSAAAHYDNTGTAVADVRTGEDMFGIWIAGALRPDVTGKQVRTLRSSPLSGDWRTVAGNLEMVAALAVNVPGFPVPRPQGLVASGDLTSLTAAGMVAPKKVRRSTVEGGELSSSDLKYLKRLADRSRTQEREELAQRVHRSKVSLAQRKVRHFATRTRPTLTSATTQKES